MKFAYLLTVLIVFATCKVNESNTSLKKVKIVLDTEEVLPETDTIFITGNQKILGDWHPHGLAMTRRSENRWEKTFTAPDSFNLEFKFTLGSFDTEAISNRGAVPSNSKLAVNGDQELYFVIEDWKKKM